MTTWIWINATFFVAGIDTDNNGVITKAPPICRYCIGWRKDKFRQYLENRRILRDWIEQEG